MPRSPRIAPCLWYDKEAGEAARLYTSIFPDSRIVHIRTVHNTPSGDAEIVTAELAGQPFTLLSAGPLFAFTPAISFVVACAAPREVDAHWARLSQGGTVLMELGDYPWSARYGWVQDRYGLSWQLMLVPQGAPQQKIIPKLMFVAGGSGKADEAIAFYASVFRNARIRSVDRFGPGEEPNAEGTVKHGIFALEGYEFAAMDSAYDHGFGFTEAISFQLFCDTQAEVDRYWERLSADPKAEQCGWLKDRFGVSWQIIPEELDAMMSDRDPAKVARVTKAFMAMKKLDVGLLYKAFTGSESEP